MLLLRPGIAINNLLSALSLPKIGLRISKIPSTGFGYVGLISDKLQISYTKDGKVKTHTINLNKGDFETQIKREISNLVKKHKLIATGFKEDSSLHKIAPSMWLEDDVVSVKIKSDENGDIDLKESLKFISAGFNDDNIAYVKLQEGNEVWVTDLVSLEDYKNVTSEQDFSTLISLAKRFGDKSISFINATPQGGGVAIMRHALIRLFKLLNVNARWFVLKPDSEAYNVTKRKFHNVLQAAADSNVRLTEEDIQIYNEWIEENATILQKAFFADIVVIDDPQPAGLIPYIKKVNPKAKIIYRSHIQLESGLIDQPDTPQHKTWEFLWKNIRLADCFVSHPVLDFVPKNVPKDKLHFMPATTDPLDGLNKDLGSHQTYYLHLFNKFLKEAGQNPLDLKRSYIIQIARFDPSKGIPDVLESYYKLCERLKALNLNRPQLVITGNGSIDDPDRAPIFSMTMDIVNSKKFQELKKDIKVIPLPHIDQLLNALLRNCMVALQLSTKEGFEIKITEALMKGKPVVAYKTGGIPLQIKDGVNGFLIPVGDTDEVAKRLFVLLTDEKYYQTVSTAASNGYDRSLLTIPNAIRWLKISLGLLS